MKIIQGTEIRAGGMIRSCQISPDGNFAIIGSARDQTARLAEIKRDGQGKIIGLETIKNAEVKAGGRVLSCQISPDGTSIIIGSDEDQTARLMEIKRDNQGKIIGI